MHFLYYSMIKSESVKMTNILHKGELWGDICQGWNGII